MNFVESKLTEILVEKLGVEESEVIPKAHFTNDLGADSLDAVEIIMEIEKEFGITIPDDQAEKILTVGDAIAYIEANSDLPSYSYNYSYSDSNENGSSSKVTLSKDEEQYLEEYKEVLADYGEIGPRERRQLERSRVRFGISERRASEIEASIETDSSDFEAEQQYLDEYTALKEDYGRIGTPQRKQLERLRERLGISETRAKQIEQYAE